ncbi:MAG: response regulator [Chloroflexi bacterium]|nr:response regulator [Chloroflexota bacterium]
MTHNGSAPIKVLIIEDGPNIQKIIAEMLLLLGYETACASNGKEGVEKAKSWQPDIVLTDLRMPVMDGSEVIRHLRSNPDTAHITIFVVSAWTDAGTRDLCMVLGADKFFAKPLNILKIHSAIQATLKPSPQKTLIPYAAPAAALT